MAPRSPTHIIPSLRFAFIAGGAAGDHTLTGVTTADKLVEVAAFTFTLTDGTPNVINAFTPDNTLIDEFSITAADTINNAGGTDLSGYLILVVWFDDDYGAKSQLAHLA